MAKILLAEDDLFLRDIYTEVLSNEEFEVTVAIDGEEALKYLLQGNWDIVLLDVVMPKMTGIQVLEHVKSQAKQNQVYAKHIVFMTNTDELKDAEGVKDMTDGYILKSSFTPDQLLERINQYLKS